jgi:hypothetical protein
MAHELLDRRDRDVILRKFVFFSLREIDEHCAK